MGKLVFCFWFRGATLAHKERWGQLVLFDPPSLIKSATGHSSLPGVRCGHNSHALWRSESRPTSASALMRNARFVGISAFEFEMHIRSACNTNFVAVFKYASLLCQFEIPLQNGTYHLQNDKNTPISAWCEVNLWLDHTRRTCDCCCTYANIVIYTRLCRNSVLNGWPCKPNSSVVDDRYHENVEHVAQVLWPRRTLRVCCLCLLLSTELFFITRFSR